VALWVPSLIDDRQRLDQPDRTLKRTYYWGNDLSRVLTIDELRARAKRRLPAFAWEYIESGAEDEHTLARNRAAFQDYRFAPATLVDTRARSAALELFGQRLPSPLIVAPTGFNGLAYGQGDLALARGAAALGLPFTLSSFSNMGLEQIAQASSGPLWMQLYMLENPAITDALLQRADAAGYAALVVTTDAQVGSGREWQRRCYRSPGRLSVRHALDAACHPRWLGGIVRHGMPRFENLREFFAPDQLDAMRGAPAITGQLKPGVTWRDLERLRSKWTKPLIVKGILSLADARRAQQAGADAIVLSNHGGRQMDDAIAPLEILDTVKQALPDLTILIDSGFRRGNDILKAVALGASAVLVGRAPLYGLAAAGQAGVEHALRLLHGEIERSLGLLGCNTLAEVSACLVRGRLPSA